MASKKCWCKSVWSLFGKRTKKRHNRRRRVTRRRNMRGG